MAPLGHTEVVDAGKEPTCTETGITDGKHCSTCGVVIVSQVEIPVSSHNYQNGVCGSCENFDPSTVTYEDYEYNMNESEKTDFIYRFDDFQGFFDWYNAAKAKYDEEHKDPVLGEDGNIDLGGGNN